MYEQIHNSPKLLHPTNTKQNMKNWKIKRKTQRKETVPGGRTG